MSDRHWMGGVGDALRTIFRPEHGQMADKVSQKDDTMLSIGRMKEAAGAMKAVAATLPHHSQILSPDRIASAIDEATDGAVDFK